MYAARVYRLESRRDQYADRVRLREQARLVAAWNDVEDDADDPDDSFYLVIRNASELPVVDVRYELVRSADQRVLTRGRMGHLRPTETKKLRLDDDLMLEESDVRLCFIDSQGIRWVRFRGVLEVAQ